MDINISLIGGGSISHKEVNQDYFLTENIPELGCNVLVVADGLGSYHKSEVASRFVCENFLQSLKNIEKIQDVNLVEVFKNLKNDLNKKYEEDFDKDKRIDNAYGTTLICCIETITEFIIGYVGNGGVFHIKGDFNSFPNHFYLPWNSINLLNPHSIEQGGMNAMYKLLSPYSRPEQCIPTIIRLSKDEFGSGDIIMICSDGIYSYDEVQIGKDPNGKIWISGEVSIEKFYKHLSEFFKNKSQVNDSINNPIDGLIENSANDLTNNPVNGLIENSANDSENNQINSSANNMGNDSISNFLNIMINNYLIDLKHNNLIDDDATIALLVSGNTLQFQEKLNIPHEGNKQY